MSQNDKQREEHLHRDQDEVGTGEQPFSEQAGPGNSQGEGGESDEQPSEEGVEVRENDDD